MNASAWRPGSAILTPVYIDASVIVGYLIRGHRLYRSCAPFVAELLATRAHVQVSPVTFTEALWGVMRQSYYELRNDTNINFHPAIFRKNHEQIMARFGDRLALIGSMLQDWQAAGLQVEWIPIADSRWDAAKTTIPDLMKAMPMASADASHVALANAHARSFVTTDDGIRSDLGGWQANNLSLMVYHLTP